jgi:hypothetical protein
MTLAEIKERWALATPEPWRMGSNWRRVSSNQGLVAEIPSSAIGVTQQMANATAIRNAAQDVAWLVSEVERLIAAHSLYQPVWEESY